MFAHSIAVFNHRMIRDAVEGFPDDGNLAAVCVGLYVAILAALSLYGGHRYGLLWKYWRTRRSKPVPARVFAEHELPGVTVQLPLFNEQYVVEGLLDSVCRLDYPRDRLQIQILDDSTDETRHIAAEAAARWRAKGLDVEFIHRVDRSGFKAGALEHGLRTAKFGLVAIFDADFRPDADFLRRTVHHFSDEKTAVVQARWGHLNGEESLLTRVQTIMLDGHFMIEHPARNRTGRFFNFNGTAGIWRIAAIRDAGGWHHETLTEDLDLSYRAQLKGWKFVYDPDVVCSAELPVEMNAFKSQQHRWAKGSVQVMKKILPTVLRSDAPFAVKTEAFFHLTGNLAYLLMLGMCVLTLPVMAARARLSDPLVGGLVDLLLFLMATASVIVFYTTAQVLAYRNWRERILAVPAMLAVGIGLTVNQAKAVCEALVGHRTAFVRTPKYAVGKDGACAETWAAKRYRGVRNWAPLVELVFAVYFTVVMGYAFAHGLYGALPFLSLFFAGFWYVALMSLFQGRASARPASPPAPAPAAA
jgi:cellulose synthase/poly-beta-1,6-N-acetylglucosamine synthase-like glycosyltransferase